MLNNLLRITQQVQKLEFKSRSDSRAHGVNYYVDYVTEISLMMLMLSICTVQYSSC